MKIKNTEDTFFNIIKFANNHKLWEEKKNILLKILNKDFKRKEFIEKHLSDNFVNLIPVAKLFNSIHGLIGYKEIHSPQYKFSLRIDFTERKDLAENNFFEFEVKLKDVATNCKVTNKKELREIFSKLLFRIGYEIGYTQGMIDRIDLDLKILKNENESLFINESIQDIQKIFYDNSVNIVKQFPHYYHMLFQFKDYIIRMEMRKNNILSFEKKKLINKFYQHITDLSNVDKKTVGQRFRDFKKRNLIPNFSKKFLPMN